MAFVYIIRCKDDTLYTGSTKDIKRRIKQHLGLIKTGRAKYTRAHLPEKLEKVWETENFSDALKLESAIKKLKRAEKQELINGTTKERFDELFPKLAEIIYENVKTEPRDILSKEQQNKKTEM